MGILIITEEDEAAIAAMVKEAKLHPLPMQIVETYGVTQSKARLGLKDFDPRSDEVRQEYPVNQMQLGTYRVAFSYEEQPAGYVRHISMSAYTSDKGDVPNNHAMNMVAQAFGFSSFPPTGNSKVWLEEYQPGRWAINMIELDKSFGTESEKSAVA